MTVTIKGMNTENTFDLSTGQLGATPTKPLEIIPRTITDGSVYDAIIMPGNYIAGALKVEFKVGSEIFIWDVGTTTFDGGNEYSYNITLKRTGVIATGTINPWITTGNDRGAVTAD